MEGVHAELGLSGSARAIGPAIQAAMSPDTKVELCAALFAERVEEASTVLRSRPAAAHTSRPVSWSTTTVR